MGLNNRNLSHKTLKGRALYKFGEDRMTYPKSIITENFYVQKVTLESLLKTWNVGRQNEFEFGELTNKIILSWKKASYFGSDIPNL